MKIYTKRGDDGHTDLFGGERVLKNNWRVRCYGLIDSANASIGFAHVASKDSAKICETLSTIMKWLFCAGAEVATASKESAQKLLDRNLSNHIAQEHIDLMENQIDTMEKELEPLKSFVLPSGCELSARLHMARCQVRMVEVMLVQLKESGEALRPEILQFFNRLSDLLFVLSRFANHEAKVKEELWSGRLS